MQTFSRHELRLVQPWPLIHAHADVALHVANPNPLHSSKFARLSHEQYGALAVDKHEEEFGNEVQRFSRQVGGLAVVFHTQS